MRAPDPGGDTMPATPPATAEPSQCPPARWRRTHSKLHTEEGITVEIRPLDTILTIIAADRPLGPERHAWLSENVRRCLGSLMPHADVTVLMGSDDRSHNAIASAIYWCDCFMLGGDIPRGVPIGTQLLEMPWTEACMHLGVAGRLMWVAPVDDDMAQLYDSAGAIFSAPILRAEAGLPIEAASAAPLADPVGREEA